MSILGAIKFNSINSLIGFKLRLLYKDNKLLTSGGRVLAVAALGNSVKEAQLKVYEAINTIKFNGVQYRKDIGYRALNND